MSRVSPKDKAYVQDVLRPVIEALRETNELRNEFLHFGGERGADLFSLSDRLRKIINLGARAPLSPYLVVMLCDFGAAKGLLKFPSKPKT